MSRGFVKVSLKGNIGNVEFKQLPSGDLAANVSIAVTEYYTNNGQREEKTTWLRGVAYKRTAELMQQLVQKGTEIFADDVGVNVRKFSGQDGVEREIAEFVIRQFDVLARGIPRQEAQQSQAQAPANQGYAPQARNNGYQQPAAPRQNGQYSPRSTQNGQYPPRQNGQYQQYPN